MKKLVSFVLMALIVLSFVCAAKVTNCSVKYEKVRRTEEEILTINIMTDNDDRLLLTVNSKTSAETFRATVNLSEGGFPAVFFNDKVRMLTEGHSLAATKSEGSSSFTVNGRDAVSALLEDVYNAFMMDEGGFLFALRGTGDESSFEYKAMFSGIMDYYFAKDSSLGLMQKDLNTISDYRNTIAEVCLY